ncbi:MAG: FecR domain-containing protein [Pseudomonadota bacterium]
MTNIVNINDRIKIEEEACHWLAKIDRQLTIAEEGEFKQWITLSAIHYKLFMAMAEHWDHTEMLKHFKNVNRKLQPDIHQKAPPMNQQKPYFYRPAIAACIFFVCMLSVLGIFKYLSPLTESDEYAIQYSETFSTATNSFADSLLPDGSRIKINAKSYARISYSNKIRKIELSKGEVFIEVAHDANRPLVVYANDRFVKAVGTAFNVNLVNVKTIKLTVTEGKVVYGTADNNEKNDIPAIKTSLVSSGQQVILGGLVENIISISKEELNRALSWRSGKLIFNGQTLKEVLTEIERYTDYKFVMGTASIGDIQIAGYFNAGDIDKFLSAMKNNFDIEYKIENTNEIRLYKAQRF